MHSVTKILMAFAAVLSIFLSAMVIAYAANTDRILQDYGNEQADRLAADAALRAGNAQWATERGNIMNEKDKLTSLSAQKDAQLAELELERASLRNERAEAQRARDSFKAQVDEFAAIIKTNQTIIDRYSQEVTELRRNELASRSQRLESDERLANLLSQVDVLTANNRVMNEQMNELQNKLAGGGSTATGNAAAFESKDPIMGQVDSVKSDTASGRTLVQLSVGSNNGVKDGMIFRVIRGDKFVANIVIRKTDLAFSVAEVDIQTNEIQVGDAVRTKL